VTPSLSPGDLLARVNRDIERNVLRARNGVRYVTGSSRPRVGITPKEVVWSRDKAQLWRYRSDARTVRPPVLLVHSLVSRSYILDLRPGSSMVEYLRDAGFDVYLLDWGVPDELDAANTLETYIDEYIPRAVDAVCRESRADDVMLAGYCLGGVLTLLYAAGHAEPAVRGLITMATPIDFNEMGPLIALVREGRLHASDLVDETGNVSPDFLYNGFRTLEPTDQVVQYANLWQHLWNDEFMEAFQAIGGWGRDHIPFPGAAFEQTVDLFARDNALMSGAVRLGRRTISLSDVACPALNVMAEHDKFVPLASSEPLAGLIGGDRVEELRLPSGHVGFAAGRQATKVTLPRLAEWIRRHSDQFAEV
jgi:polyhydroxyalkanoate synthase